MRQTAFILCAFLVVSAFEWYQNRTDLPDGDAELGCAVSSGLDIGQDLPDQYKSDYSHMPKAQWFRLRGQLIRMSYDATTSDLPRENFQQQGNCYFQANSGLETEYIQSIPFPRAFSSASAYNYYFSALMADFDGGIEIQLEWYNDNNELMNTTMIRSTPLSLTETCTL